MRWKQDVQWTEEDKRILTEMWSDHSAGAIAKRLGRTRNSIIGMVHRMRLPRKTPAPDNKPRPVRTPKLLKVHVMVKPLPVTQPEAGKGIPILEAASNQCKAVIESSTGPDGLALVCGQPVTPGRFFEFCEYHMARYTQKATRGSRNV